MCGSTPITVADPAETPSEVPYLEVAVATILGTDGRYLLSQRHADAHQGGRWEFPGGKVEQGETPEEALQRELEEELGISPLLYKPLISIPYHYPEKAVRLHVFRVLCFTGTPQGREGQSLQWYSLPELARVRLPDANRGILTALTLPDHYLITGDPGADDEAFILQLESALARGVRLVQLRAKNISDVRLRHLAAASVKVCYRYGANLMINGPEALAREVGAQGIHLTSKTLADMQSGERPQDLWLGASCHNQEELAHSVSVGVDFAVCSPVNPTISHPDARPIGWTGFAALCAQAPFPIYALGGMEIPDIEQAQYCGGQGIAGISGLWR